MDRNEICLAGVSGAHRLLVAGDPFLQGLLVRRQVPVLDFQPLSIVLLRDMK